MDDRTAEILEELEAENRCLRERIERLENENRQARFFLIYAALLIKATRYRSARRPNRRAFCYYGMGQARFCADRSKHPFWASGAP